MLFVEQEFIRKSYIAIKVQPTIKNVDYFLMLADIINDSKEQVLINGIKNIYIILYLSYSFKKIR